MHHASCFCIGPLNLEDRDRADLEVPEAPPVPVARDQVGGVGAILGNDERGGETCESRLPVHGDRRNLEARSGRVGAVGDRLRRSGAALPACRFARRLKVRPALGLRPGDAPERLEEGNAAARLDQPDRIEGGDRGENQA